jgi:hypothetical protein
MRQTTDGDRIGVPAYGRVGENDVVKPRAPERNPRENARSSMTVDQRPQRFLVQWLLGAFRDPHLASRIFCPTIRKRLECQANQQQSHHGAFSASIHTG